MTSPCRQCIAWKRRTPISGTCWQRVDYYPDARAMTYESDTCEQFAPKVIGPSEALQPIETGFREADLARSLGLR